jgi:hypothetical protein
MRLAADALDLHPADIRLEVAPDGRRRLSGGPWASIASRPGWIAVALAPVPVGVDVELVSEADAAPDLVWAGLSSRPGAEWYGAAGIWAAKEACLKAQGLGLEAAERGWRFLAGGRVEADGLAAHRVVMRLLPGAAAALAVPYGKEDAAPASAGAAPPLEVWP